MPTKKKSQQKPEPELTISPLAGLEMVHLVEELQRLDQYEYNRKKQKYDAFCKGVPIYLFEVASDQKFMRQRRKIIKQIKELAKRGC